MFSGSDSSFDESIIVELAKEKERNRFQLTQLKKKIKVLGATIDKHPPQSWDRNLTKKIKDLSLEVQCLRNRFI